MDCLSRPARDVVSQFPASGIGAGVLEEAVVFLGHGDGTFSVGRGFPCSGANNRFLAIADFNEDGRKDVIVVSGGTSTITATATLLQGNGERTLALARTFVWPAPAGDAVGAGVAVADLNRDGHADVVIGDEFNPTVIFLGHGDGTFLPGTTIAADPGGWRTLAVGDLNHDGKPDLVGAAPVGTGGSGYAPKVVVALGRGDGTFSPAVQYSLAYNLLSGIAIGDFDSGGPDIAVTGFDGQIEMLLNRGNGTFGAGTFLEPNEYYFLGGSRADNLLAADLNGDGLPDLVVATQQTATLAGGLLVLRNTTPPHLGSLHLLTPPTVELGGHSTVTVMAFDQFDRPFVGYGGSVEFLTSAPGACVELPPNYTFTPADAGIHVFDVPTVAMSVGSQTLTVTDAGAAGISRSATIVAEEGLVVTTTADVVAEDGQVSLREAILRANALARPVDDPALIRFNICGAATGPIVIKPTSALPALHGFTVVDGFSQPGASANALEVGDNAIPRIVLDGGLAGDGVTGLTTESPVTIQGLEICHFSGSGINAHKSGGAVIQGNYIHDNLDHGILLEQGNSLAGGSLPAYRNIITGNHAAGIWLGHDITGNLGHRVEGNFVGPDPQSRSTTAGQSLGGIVVIGCSNTMVGGASEPQRNVIASNIGPGIMIIGARDSSVRANFIGLAADGEQMLGNALGIIVSNSFHTVIGGSKFADGNVISGNLLHGIVVSQGARETAIQANRIGTGPDGGQARPNGGDGITILADAADTQIGGGTVLTANVVSGNQANGIRLSGGNRTTILGNLIGTALDGLTPMGNSGAGVAISIDPVVFGAPDQNSIGGVVPGAGNTIAYNSQAGVIAKTGFKHNIRGNSIHGNTGLGIDLGGDGVTANDPGDGDNGPNGLQNYPVLFSAETDGSTLTVSGMVASAPGVTLNLDYYWNLQCHAAGSGEGRTYLGSGTVSTDSARNASLGGSFATFVPAGAFVTAIASTVAGDTSEFSPCQLVTGSDTRTFGGLDHRALAGAVVTPDGTTLRVSNLGPSGSDSVDVVLGEADGWRGEFVWPPLTGLPFRFTTSLTGKSGSEEPSSTRQPRPTPAWGLPHRARCSRPLDWGYASARSWRVSFRSLPPGPSRGDSIPKTTGNVSCQLFHLVKKRHSDLKPARCCAEQSFGCINGSRPSVKPAAVWSQFPFIPTRARISPPVVNRNERIYPKAAVEHAQAEQRLQP